MNSKSVLNKILTLLSLDETAVNFTDAKDAQGNILQSPTFDLNEKVEVVHEDGTKTPAADGEYTISLKDESGNENIIRIEVKDGKIVERANEEEEKNEPSEEADMEKPKEEVVDKSVDEKKDADVKMADAKMEPAHALPNTTDEDPRNRIGEDTDDKKDPIIALSYRISEMEKQMKTMMEKFGDMNPPAEEGADESVAPSANLPEDGVAMSAEDDEEELPKLDGAPVEAGFKFSSDKVHKLNNSGKIPNSQNSFLAKLYS